MSFILLDSKESKEPHVVNTDDISNVEWDSESNTSLIHTKLGDVMRSSETTKSIYEKINRHSGNGEGSIVPVDEFIRMTSIVELFDILDKKREEGYMTMSISNVNENGSVLLVMVKFKRTHE